MARKRILLVDDYGPFATSLRMALLPEHDVVAERSGEQALGLLRGEDRFDAVLCELAIPGMSGQDLYRQVQESDPGLARCFVFVTAAPVSSERAKFFAEEGTPVLRKPFELHHLSELLNRLWAEAPPEPLAPPGSEAERQSMR